MDDMLPLGPQLALLEATLLADLRECCRRLQVMFLRKLREIRGNVSFCVEILKNITVSKLFFEKCCDFRLDVRKKPTQKINLPKILNFPPRLNFGFSNGVSWKNSLSNVQLS